jgi:hypothetical protein
MNPEKPHQRVTRLRAARLFTNVLNPFFVFTALYVFVAMSEASAARATLYLAVELAAAAFVAGYVFLLRRRRRVGDFWISGRRQRLVPALVLLGAFGALLAALALLGAPETLFLTTLSMGLASAAVAATTLVWKASAHSAVAGHAAATGLLVLGPPGLLFALTLPAVLWSRVAAGDHTLAQALAGAGIGAIFATTLLG